MYCTKISFTQLPLVLWEEFYNEQSQWSEIACFNELITIAVVFDDIFEEF